MVTLSACRKASKPTLINFRLPHRPIMIARTDEYDYPLLEDAIAQRPLPRGTTRLFVGNRTTGTWADARFADLPHHLPSGALLILNDTKVIPARLPVRFPGGGKGEILLLKKTGVLEYRALVRPGRKLGPGKVLALAEGMEVRIISVEGRGERRVAFSSDPAALMAAHGRVPLPPYIRRDAEPGDHSDYQTVYAREDGSVAAPTAGLHFTSAMLRRLGESGIEVAFITLHVGPGTFRPITAATLDGHRMDAEAYSIPEAASEAIRRARLDRRPIIGVGTTVCRTLESAAIRNDGDVPAGEGETDLFITPGFHFRVLDGLLTNFHMPRSTPLVLASSFAGRDRIIEWYGKALAGGYRFLSYGDAMLIL